MPKTLDTDRARLAKALRKAARLRGKSNGRDPQTLAQVRVALADTQAQVDALTQAVRILCGVNDGGDTDDTE
jgi:alkanesulfonate monooxygenase SsuD/methylene tetrahydromethanopterin reductase-like flavin-dependent oxidoreductase (luciferase family)